MKIIGVTGRSGTGKTTLCAILKEKYGAYIIDADEVARNLSKKGTMYLSAIVECFGNEIINTDGELKRSELANLIYEDKDKRNRLNRLTFIYVVQEIKEKINKLKKEKIIVIDAPLLFESNLNQVCDFVIGVIAEDTAKVERICERDHITEEMAKKRLAIQITEEEIRKKADYVIKNEGDRAELEKEIAKIQNKFN